MGFFDAPQLALASGKSVFYAELFRLDYRSSGTDGLYWDGFGDLDAYGFLWTGAGNVVSRGEIPFGVDDEAGQLVLTMSGVDAAVVSKVRAEEEEIYNQPITIWGQFFDEALQLSGGRFLLFQGTMDVPTYNVSPDGMRSIIIPCEGEWTDRNTAAFSMFSDRDQQARFPGDKGLEYAYRYTQGVRRRWPQFS